MKTDADFSGFPEGCIEFLVGLARNNNKTWFDAHRKEYEEFVIAPARAFVEALGQRLCETWPRLVVDPRVNKSIFRINRDIRFSKDKRPYKTHLACLFWDDRGKKMESPGFYFHVEPPQLILAAGYRTFPKPVLTAYRDAVVDEASGIALERAMKKVTGAGEYRIGQKTYARVPAGYDKNHPRAELLKYGGLGVMAEPRLPRVFHSAALVEFCLEHYRNMAPLYDWLLDLFVGSRA